MVNDAFPCYQCSVVARYQWLAFWVCIVRYIDLKLAVAYMKGGF